MTAEILLQRPPPQGERLDIGPIRFDPVTGELAGPAGRERLDLKVAEVLLALHTRAGEVVSREELLARVWPGLVVTDDVLRRCIYQLRNHLGRVGGDAGCKSLLETLPKRGYRLQTGKTAAAAYTAAAMGRPFRFGLVAAGLLTVIGVLAWLAIERFGDTGRTVPATPSVAVLPFDDMSHAQDQRYFAEGLAEEILNLLAQLPELRVIARTSSFSLHDRGDLDIRAIGKRLGVTHLLEGSVRRSADRLRVTAQLVRSSDGSHVWSRTYDRDTGDLLEVQREIAAEIARTLEIRFAEPATRSGVRAVNPAAHEQYLLARFLWSRRGADDLAAAQHNLERAVGLDPNHAQAWALLSGVRFLRIFYDDQDPDAALESMEAAIGRALALAPESGEVHARAAQYYGAAGDFKRATEHWERAVALAPNNMLVVSFSKGVALARGEFAEALRHQRRAVELDPVGFVSRHNLAVTLLIIGRYEEAWQELQRARQLNSSANGLKELTAELLVLRGRHAEGLEAALRLPDGPRRDFFLVLAYEGLGRTADAEAALTALRARGDAESIYRVAEMHAWRGDSDAAFEWLERAWAAMTAEGLVPGDRVHPAHFLDSGFLHPLHDDPRLARYFGRPDRIKGEKRGGPPRKLGNGDVPL